MQLFSLDHIDLKGNDVIIDNPEIWQQAKKVLRLGAGDQIFVQVKSARYEVIISELRDLKIFGKIANTQQAPTSDRNITMIIAMPNKWEKAELIVQKLTEIGVSDIIFRPSERSVIKERNANKVTRLEKIMKEAMEQSRGRQLPTVTFCSDIHKQIENNRLIVFDKDGKMEEWKHATEGSPVRGNMNEELDRPSTGRLYGLIGPEGGRGPKDYELFKKYNVETKDLGATILRMETAAIVGAWILKNNFG